MISQDHISFFVLSCDKYSDLWEDFFCLKEKFWPDCPFEWHVVTESNECKHTGIKTIKCGKELNWTGRIKKACEIVNSDYICFFLDDFFINDTVENDLINECIGKATNEEVDYYVLGDAFARKIKTDTYYNNHIAVIPTNRPYGIDTSVAIWKKEFLVKLVGEKDCSAWQFELDRLEEARQNVHKDRKLWYDERLPLNVGSIPVVIQGKFYPKAIKDFKCRGYVINTSSRPVMTGLEVFKYDMKVFFSSIGFLKSPLKRFAGKFMGYKFFTK